MPEDYPTDFDTRIKVVVYRATAKSGTPPSIDAVADEVGESPAAVKESYTWLRASRLLLLETDGATIRMAPPFSGAPASRREWTRAVDVAFSLPCAGGEMVGRPAIYLKQYALLPVGRTRSRMASRARN
jgi:hypothetical protein